MFFIIHYLICVFFKLFCLMSKGMACCVQIFV